MFQFKETQLAGCFEVQPQIFEDLRGQFVKTYHQKIFGERGLNTDWPEEYYTVSRKNVLRGMHCQLPPHDHEKLVYCPTGEVIDVVVDLRRGSPSEGQYAMFRLSEKKGNMVYLPKGVAHGFFVMSSSATMMYKVASIYAPQHDTGILWNSFGFNWPLDLPTLSSRDSGFESLANFKSPFVYNMDNK